MSGPVSNTNNPFSFNFHISDADESAVEEIRKETTNNDVTDHSKVESIELRPRLPFKWINDDKVKVIMSERSKQALVYSDISLVNPDGPERNGNTASKNDLSLLQEANGGGEIVFGETEPSPPHPPTTIRCVDLSLSSFRKKSPTEEDTERVDIVPGIYEGGRQVWECSIDLLQFLAKNHVTVQQHYGVRNHNVMSAEEDDIPLEVIWQDASKKTYVLELGCGHGLPGIYLLREALQSGVMKPAEFTIVFTDYNESVLLDATISNTVLNCVNETLDDDPPWTNTSDKVAKHVVLGGGDWLDMSQQLEENLFDNELLLSKLPSDGYFDLILAAETIYSTSTAHETASLLKRHLRPDTGIAYIASKRYYFGVGGGVDAFRDYCENMTEETRLSAGGESRLIVNTVKVIDNGTGNIREILSVQNRRCVT